MPAGPLHTLWHALNWIICRRQIQKKHTNTKIKQTNTKIKQTNTNIKQTNTKIKKTNTKYKSNKYQI